MKFRPGLFSPSSAARPLLATACVLAGMLASAHAQTPGTLDTSFSLGTGTDFEVNALALEPNGQILVGGQFTTIEGVPYAGIALLNANGTVDTSFSPGTGVETSDNTGVYAIAIQPDGKVVLGGLFSTFSGEAHSGIVRLNTNGSIDESFVAQLGNSDDIRALAIQSDGKIVIGGGFALVDGAPHQNLARLNADGSLDTAFATGSAGVEGEEVRAIVIQPDGKILVGGEFSSENSAAFDNIERFNTNGTVDSSFNPGDGTDQQVYALALQSDGKVVIGGLFENVNGVARDGIARLNADGTLDASFNPNPNVEDAYVVYALAIQADGKIVAGADSGDGVGVFRFNPDGSTDTSYTTGINGKVLALALQSDNNLIVGGNIGNDAGTTVPDVFRLFGGPLSSTPPPPATPAFFNGEVSLGNGVYYLAFPNGNIFGYYSFLSDPHYIFHQDLGYEYVFDAADGKEGVYLYDFASSDFFYTSPTFPFPYLYDFGLNSVVYYYPDPNNPGRYNTNGVRYFFVFNTGQIISK